MEAGRFIPAPCFSKVEISYLKEMISESQAEPTIEDMLDDTQEQEEEQKQAHEVIMPGEPITKQLSEVLKSLARANKQILEFDGRPHLCNMICPTLENTIEHTRPCT